MIKAALVACSNPLSQEEHTAVEKLKKLLLEMCIEVVESPILYAEHGCPIGQGKERADILNQFYRDPVVDAIFDLSGGDMGNEILPYLDYEQIKKSNKVFYGYSDLTTVINAIASQTQKASVLFQMKTLAWDESGEQAYRFYEFLTGDKKMFQPQWKVLQGEETVEKMLRERTTVGGNIRCFLKLAGTKYFPDLTDRILFLESLGGGIPQISTYFASLYQLGAFEKVKGILLGTFTQLERENGEECAFEILKQYLPEGLFVAKTQEVGHAKDSRALWIG